MVCLLQLLNVQVGTPEFDPWSPCKSERPTPQSCPLTATCCSTPEKSIHIFKLNANVNSSLCFQGQLCPYLLGTSKTYR